MIQLEQMITEALAFYPFQDPTYELIRHNENATYKVTDIADGMKYVMRIHRPTQGFTFGCFGVTGHSTTYLQSELDIISDLKKNKVDSLQTPTRNKYGKLITLLSDNTLVTVLEWLDGEILEKLELSEEILFGIGEMVANLHRHFIENKSVDRYNRYAYDQTMIPRIADKIVVAVERKSIKEEQSNIIMDTLQEIKKRMDELDLIE